MKGETGEGLYTLGESAGDCCPCSSSSPEDMGRNWRFNWTFLLSFSRIARSWAMLSSESTRPAKAAGPVLEELRGVWYSSGVSGERMNSLLTAIAEGAMVRVGRRRGLLAGMAAIVGDDEHQGSYYYVTESRSIRRTESHTLSDRGVTALVSMPAGGRLS